MRGLPGLKSSRECARMTQGQLADKVQMSVQTISFLECGRADPSAETLRRLSDVLGCSVDALLASQPPASEGQPVIAPERAAAEAGGVA